MCSARVASDTTISVVTPTLDRPDEVRALLANLALSARRQGWKLGESGRARCVHLHSPRGRGRQRSVARKTAVNYRFVFVDIVPNRTIRPEIRFWRVQLVDLLRQTAWALRHGGKNDWAAALGKVEGIFAATRVRPGAITPP
jgi:hypothetical protein